MTDAKLESGGGGVPRVTIGLPVYNGERYLADALDSLREQTFLDFEVVISDNDSTDATESICRATEGYAAGPRGGRDLPRL